MAERSAVALFGEWARIGRDEGMEAGHSPSVDEMVAAVIGRTPDRFSAIDVGCGKGWAVRRMARLGNSRLKKVSDSFANFRMVDRTRHAMHNEGPISHRHNQNPSQDTLPVGGAAYAAVVLNNSMGRRLAQIYIEQQHAFEFSAKSIAVRRDVEPLSDGLRPRSTSSSWT